MSSATSLRQMFDLSGKTALVTGGSKGLGLQIAEALGEFGASLILTARKTGDLSDAQKQFESVGIDCMTVAVDLSAPEGSQALVDDISAKGRSIEILVNNAGNTWGAPTEEMPLQAWEKVIALNLTAPFLLTQAVASRWMLPRGYGRIINVASVEGLSGHHPRMVGTIGYNASKGGLVNFTRALAAEWGGRGITVNALAPGYFPSKLTARTIEQFEHDLVAETPRGALGGPADLKGASVLFASDASAHITGQVLAIDGGASVI